MTNPLLEDQMERMIHVNPSSNLYKVVKEIETAIKTELPNSRAGKCRTLSNKIFTVVKYIREEVGERKHYRQEKAKGNPVPKDIDLTLPFINISNVTWKKLVGCQYWHTIKEYMIKYKVLDVNDSYSNDPEKTSTGKTFSKSYRIDPEFTQICKAKDGSDDEGYEVVEIDIHPDDDFPEELIIEENPYWLNFNAWEKEKWSKISLNLQQLPKALKRSKKRKGWDTDVYVYWLKRCMRAVYNPKPPTESITGREYNSINNLPREVREVITIDGKQTTELDIKSCFAFLLYSLIEDKQEKEDYADLIKSGTFYEEIIPFVKDFKHPDYQAEDERELAKICFSKFVSGAKLGVKCRKELTGAGLVAKYFRDRFPKLTKSIAKIMRKKGDLARHLQRMESDIIVRGLFDKGVLCISIHDGILVKQSEAKNTRKILSDLCEEQIGIAPIITAKSIKPNKSHTKPSKSLNKNQVYNLQNTPKALQEPNTGQKRGFFIHDTFKRTQNDIPNNNYLFQTEKMRH